MSWGGGGGLGVDMSWLGKHRLRKRNFFDKAQLE